MVKGFGFALGNSAGADGLFALTPPLMAKIVDGLILWGVTVKYKANPNL